VLWERVGPAREELVALADELESAEVVDPHTIIELQRLLSCGCGSPLLNPRLPASELVSWVRRARFQIVTAPLRAEPDRRSSALPAAASSQDRNRGRMWGGLKRLRSMGTRHAKLS
jgi:hypothetical protein